MSIIKRKRRNNEGIVVADPTWTVDFQDHLDVRRRIPAFKDKAASTQLEQNIKKLVSVRQVGGSHDSESNRFLESCPVEIRDKLAEWGIINAERAAAGRRLSEHVRAWGVHLRAKQCAERHCVQATARVERILGECGIVYWSDLAAQKVERWLADFRKAGAGNRTSNSYLSSAKAFCSWMVKSGFASESPLVRLGILNEAIGRRRERRAFTVEELVRLLGVAEAGPLVNGLTGHERALLYRLAAETGLRWSELWSLTRRSFDFTGETATVTIAAANAKNRKEDVLPLRPELATDMKAHLALSLLDAKAFPNMWMDRGAKMIRVDLEAAGIPYIDEYGRQADFHALRHTFISNLARAGVHPKIAQDLARHSTVELTMRNYTHTMLESRVEALEKLPSLPHSQSNVVEPETRTGTADFTRPAAFWDTPRDTFSPNLDVQIRTYVDAKTGDFVLQEEGGKSSRRVPRGSRLSHHRTCLLWHTAVSSQVLNLA